MVVPGEGLFGQKKEPLGAVKLPPLSKERAKGQQAPEVPPTQLDRLLKVLDRSPAPFPGVAPGGCVVSRNTRVSRRSKRSSCAAFTSWIRTNAMR